MEEKKQKFINDAKEIDNESKEIYVSIFINLFNCEQSFSKIILKLNFRIDAWYFLKMETRN